MVVLVVDSAAAAVEGKGGVRHPAKVGCNVAAPLKDLKPFRLGIQLAFCVCDPDETGFSTSP